MPNVAVIIVNYRSAELTIKSLRTVAAARGSVQLHAYVIENDSGDGARLTDALAAPEFADWVSLVISPKNGGFASGNNLAIRTALSRGTPPDAYFLLNPDTEVQPFALERLVSFLNEHPSVAIVGPKLLSEDGSEWNWAFRFPNIWGEFDRGLRLGLVTRLLDNHVGARRVGSSPERVDWLPGAALLIRREVFERVGLMDEGYFLYYEETDFILAAARAGLQCWYFPDARVMHIAGHSTGVTTRGVKKKRLPSYWFESRRRFFTKNFGRTYAALADLAYIAGSALFQVRRTLSRKEDSGPPHLVRDLIRHSFRRAL